MIWFILGISLIIFLIIRFRKVKIKWKTLFKKGFKVDKSRYGVYCYCGKQGSGKTYSVVEFLKHNQDMEIHSNIKSLKNIKYNYFTGFDNLLKLKDKKNCIIVYDEIFTALTKSSKMTSEVLDFLSQMRKRKIIFLTTAQEWLEINITLRRYCRYQIECNILFWFLIKRIYDAEQLKWNVEENEYIAPLIELTLSKLNLETAKSYDTFEQIETKNS